MYVCFSKRESGLVEDKQGKGDLLQGTDIYNCRVWLSTPESVGQAGRKESSQANWKPALAEAGSL